ncbi:ABC transporter permease [Mycolicibacterium sp.]|uniref:ABC transporter permease n=1 Tax=Mycolicibacterium sp. TaxID=2320850 RepID=UPI003D0E9C35
MTATVVSPTVGAQRPARLIRGPVATRVLVLLALYAVFAVLSPSFRGTSAMYSIGIGFGLIGIVAVGVGLTMIVGELDLSVGSTAALGAVIGATVSGLGLAAAVLIAAAVGAAIGIAQGWLVARTGLNSLVLTIATLIAIGGAARVLAGDRTVLVADLSSSEMLNQQLAFVLRPSSSLAIVICVVLAILLWRTRFGRQFYAVGGGRAEAAAAGIRSAPVIMVAFTVSGATAALAGSMQALASGSADPTAYGGLLTQAITAVLVGGVALSGGVGTVGGIVAGTLILQTLTTGLTALGVAPYLTAILTGVLLIAIVLVDVLTSRRSATQLRLFRARRMDRTIRHRARQEN